MKIIIYSNSIELSLIQNLLTKNFSPKKLLLFIDSIRNIFLEKNMKPKNSSPPKLLLTNLYHSAGSRKPTKFFT